VIPRLKDAARASSFESSGPRGRLRGTDAGAGEDPSRRGRVRIAARGPRARRAAGRTPVAVHASAHMLSFTEPNPRVKYQIEASTDGGKPGPDREGLADRAARRGPKSGWSQSFVWGEARVSRAGPGRFSNSGNIEIRRAEAHLSIARREGRTRVTFDWTDDGGATASRTTSPPASARTGTSRPARASSPAGSSTPPFRPLGAEKASRLFSPPDGKGLTLFVICPFRPPLRGTGRKVGTGIHPALKRPARRADGAPILNRCFVEYTLSTSLSSMCILACSLLARPRHATPPGRLGGPSSASRRQHRGVPMSYFFSSSAAAASPAILLRAGLETNSRPPSSSGRP
jgi:hypothetical protein